MKALILFFSCLFWCVFHSSSIPFGGGCENVCDSNDTDCWQLCLSTPSFAEACGKVKACKLIRQREPNNPGCKGVPTECGGTPPKAPKPMPKPVPKPMPKPVPKPPACGLVEACKKMRIINPNIAKCKGVPTTCGSSRPPPPSPPSPPPPRRGECKCLPKELEGPGNLQIGNCLTRDPANDKHYCYVDRNNGCSDSKASRRLPDLIYSYEACVNQRKIGFASPDESCLPVGDENCRDDDEQCWLALLSSPSKSEECREDDVECFLALLSSPAQSDSGCTAFSCSSVDCGCSNDDIDCHIECLNCILP